MRPSPRPPWVVAVFALAVASLPARGGSSPDPVRHPEWAEMMLRGLDLADALEHASSPARLFAVLSWRHSEWLDATQHIPRSNHDVELERGAPALLRATGEAGEVSFPVTVARAGEYRLRVKMAGEPRTPAGVEVVRLRGGASRSATLVPPPTRQWVEAGRPLRLPPGTYRATFALPRAAVLERLELAPLCVAPIEPLGGWQERDTLDAVDLAVTLVRAVDRERELPPADTPLDVPGPGRAGEDGLSPSARFEGGTSGRRAVVTVDVPADGLYSLFAFGLRTAGQRWAADECRTAVTCPLPSRLPTWWPVMTLPLSAGRHRFTVDLGPGDAVDRVRLERRKDTGEDYVSTLRRMGFDVGQGPVSREKADEALSWLRKRQRIELGETCWEPGGPALERAPLPPPPWGEPIAEPPARPPCQPPSSPVLPDPCGPEPVPAPAPGA